MTMPHPQSDNRPKEVDASFWLWISAVALGVLGFIISYQAIQAAQDEAVRQALADNPTFDRTTFENAMTVGFTVGLVFWLLFFAALIVFAFLMRGGRHWARIVTVVLGGLYLAVVFFGGLVGLSSGSGLASALGLIQLLLLIGAIVTMFRPAANAWFRPRQPGF